MYYRNDQNHLSLEEFSLPFSGRLLQDNRWVRLAGLMLWEYIEEIYVQNMSGETGRPALSSRIAFGAIFIKALYTRIATISSAVPYRYFSVVQISLCASSEA